MLTTEYITNERIRILYERYYYIYKYQQCHDYNFAIDILVLKSYCCVN